VFNPNLLSLLQLVSPALPVGAYSYSEGLETLVDQGVIADRRSLLQWLSRELTWGSIRLDAAIAHRAHQAAIAGEVPVLLQWNQWLSAARETEELRLQHWQMGRSLLQLAQKLALESGEHNRSLIYQKLMDQELQNGCNFAIAFGLVAADWAIEAETMTLGYLYSWASNLVSAAVRLIPLGQTEGQQVLRQLHPILSHRCRDILEIPDLDLACCSWGLALASMAHETQYSRLFRS